MSEDMNLSINGQSQVPPGFRFHPTEEELLNYYLRKKVGFEKIDLDVIREVDLNKLEPWDIQEKCKIGSTPQNDWYFFSHKDKKYPTGTRTNRATAAGFWKATGRDKIIYSGFKRIGLRKTLVFYKGRAPHGQKSDWIMHEYRLDDNPSNDSIVIANPISIPTDPAAVEEGWVVCRVFKKKNYQKAMDSPNKALSSFSNIMNSSHTNPNHNLLLNNLHHNSIPSSRNDGVLDQILLYMGRTCKLENDQQQQQMINTTNMISNHTGNNHQCFIHLPRLETIPNNDNNSSSTYYKPNPQNHLLHGYNSMEDLLLEGSNNVANDNNNWAALDSLVASQLNGYYDPSIATSSFRSLSPEVDVAVHMSSSYNKLNPTVYEADSLWHSNSSL